MASWLIAVVGVIYLLTTVSLFFTKQPWLGVAFFGYAIGNVGLYMVARGHP